MTEETKTAISSKIALELEAVQISVHRYIAERSGGSNGPLALHQGFGLLQSDLVPKLVDELIKYCLDVGLRDADLIAKQIQDGLASRLASLGTSLAASSPGSSAGYSLRQGAMFGSWASAYLNQVPARARVASEVRRQSDSRLPKPSPAVTDTGLVFVSCGQCTDREINLGGDICKLINGTPGLSAYFAQNVNSVESLSANIFQNLYRASAFVAVMHHRGEVAGWHGAPSHTRASVWVEQEIAIAAFINATDGRQLKIAAYAQKGIKREGVRENLILNPKEFEHEGEVLADLAGKLRSWAPTLLSSNATPARSPT